MGAKKTKSTTVQNSSLPPEFLPYYQRIFSAGENAMNRVPTNPYTGDFVAPANQMQYGGLDLREAAARQLPSDLGQSTVRLGEDIAAGKYLNPETNPYLRAMVEAANTDTTNAFARNLLPTLRGSATGAGAFSGVRRDLAEAQLAADTQRNLLSNATNIYGSNYAAERGYQMQAPQLIQSGVQLSQLPGLTMTDIGEYRRQLAQDAIENELKKKEELIAAPFRGINQMLPVLGLNVGMNTWGQTKGRMGSPFGG